MPRLANGRGLRAHRTYTVAEAARACDVTEGSVRQWLRQGLEHTEGRPTLIHGADLKAFLDARNRSRKKPLGPTEFYCLPCGAPRPAAGDMADYVPRTETSGTLQALCPICSTMLNRHVSQADLSRFKAVMDVSAYEAGEDIKHLDQTPR
jgi:hypothetical protein